MLAMWKAMGNRFTSSHHKPIAHQIDQNAQRWGNLQYLRAVCARARVFWGVSQFEICHPFNCYCFYCARTIFYQNQFSATLDTSFCYSNIDHLSVSLSECEKEKPKMSMSLMFTIFLYVCTRVLFLPSTMPGWLTGLVVNDLSGNCFAFVYTCNTCLAMNSWPSSTTTTQPTENYNAAICAFLDYKLY